MPRGLGPTAGCARTADPTQPGRHQGAFSLGTPPGATPTSWSYGPLGRGWRRHRLQADERASPRRDPSASGYIIPLMSGMPPPDSLSGISATIASVVRMFLAIEAAFCSAERVTIAGSMTPAATRSTISLLAAFRP